MYLFNLFPVYPSQRLAKSDINKHLKMAESPKLFTSLLGVFVGNSSDNQSSSLGTLFKKPAGSWECDTCMIQNKPELEKCAACETPKPKPKTSAPPTSVPTSKVHIKGESVLCYFSVVIVRE